VRLTAPDGYRAQRSYSIASAADGDRVELTVQRVPDGEVSSHLSDVLAPGDPIELRGPVGGRFVWHPMDTAPVLLVAGGSGIVPLVAMMRARAAAGSTAAFRLIYSARTPEDVIYANELRRVRNDAGPCGLRQLHPSHAGRVAAAARPARCGDAARVRLATGCRGK